MQRNKFARTYFLIMKVQGRAKPKSVMRKSRIKLLKKVWEKTEDMLMKLSNELIDTDTTAMVYQIVAIP